MKRYHGNQLRTYAKQIGLGLSVAALVAGTSLFSPVTPAKADTIEYGKGTFEISAPIVIPDGYSLKGAGIGQTIIKAAPGYTGIMIQTTGSLDATTATVHHPGVEIHDLTVDGNKTAFRGIYVNSVDDFVIENVEAKNTVYNAIEHRGTLKTYYTERQTWSNVTAHDCGGWGIFNATRTRKVSYVNLKVTNCNNGMAMDHSEAQMNGLQVANNKNDGFWIRNVFGVNVSDVRATANGRYGIHVQGMVYSVGSSWLAENNAKTDIWFDASAPQPTFNYGVTRGTAISGVVAGHIPYDLGQYQGKSVKPIVIDSGVDVALGNSKVLNY